VALGVFLRPSVPHQGGEVSQRLDLVVDEPVGLGERQGLKQEVSPSAWPKVKRTPPLRRSSSA
jgi:hypothetical protein